jgi:hypothetical protein
MKTLLAFAIATLALTLSTSAAPAAAPDDGSSFTLRPDYSHKEICDVYDILGEHQESQFFTCHRLLVSP